MCPFCVLRNEALSTPRVTKYCHQCFRKNFNVFSVHTGGCYTHLHILAHLLRSPTLPVLTAWASLPKSDLACTYACPCGHTHTPSLCSLALSICHHHPGALELYAVNVRSSDMIPPCFTLSRSFWKCSEFPHKH